MDINTCFETTSYYHTIAYYSHLIPVAIAFFLAIYALIKTKFATIAIIFLFFVSAVSLWLLNDVIIWTVPNYFYVVFFWSWIDYINVIFFVLAVYFFGTLTRGEITKAEKITLLALCVPAFIFTLTGNAITNFDQTWCEALNNDKAVLYKVFVEWVSTALIFLSLIIAWKKSNRTKKIQSGVIFLSLILFLSTFSITEYIAATTFIYEVNLYGLFVLPLFLIAMVYAITNLQVFNIRFLGTQLLVYVLIIMVASQFLFLQSTADMALNVITLTITIVFGLLLLQNSKRELESKIKIEKLAKELEVANKNQTELIHFITHQVKGFFTKSRNIFDMLRDGSYGEMPATARPLIEEGFASDTRAVATVQDILKASDLRKGTMIYNKKDFNLQELVKLEFEKWKPQAEGKGLAVKLEVAEGDYNFTGDKEQLAHAVRNLLDNAMRYTTSGSIAVALAKHEKRNRLTITDTGVGINAEDMAKLFTEGGRGKESLKINTDSTGYGLFIVRGIVEAQNGKVWAESQGTGHGSTFVLEV